MTGLVTAQDVHSFGDFGYADQEGEEVNNDTVFFCLEHPPWMCLSKYAQDTLDGLEPPASLRQDFNKTIIDHSIHETWSKVDYENRYIEHLESSKEARKDLRRITTLAKHKQVCIICQDEFYQFCIRRLIYEYIQENGVIGK